ncbi:MAG: FKBP-type peptidyl-prolyl cis-trans isomerase [Chloroflexi bacterium]|nr:FKBP-type peptidyl-prolyl cis-trans isomerase [Chloroflexota bacterium]
MEPRSGSFVRTFARTRRAAIILALGSTLLLSACNPFAKPPPPAGPTNVSGLPEVASPSGLKYVEIVQGTGRETRYGGKALVQYTGWLTDGTQFDTSVGTGPIEFAIGARKVIKGWEEGVLGMKVGGKRRLIVPPDLGYGEQKTGPIPANSTLLFDVELLDAH